VVTIEEISSGDTLDLRSRVLRAGRPHEGFAEDGDPATIHLGARVNGELVGVATLVVHEDATWQLRAMAVDDRQQGSGVGRALLDAGEACVRGRGGRLVWANARDTALGFYERVGFRVVGEGYRLPSGVPGGLPHHRVEHALTG
jgi:GNAT superfamily N-acetyltransferase